MGLYEYMMLSDTEQWSDLWENGTFLTHHIEADKKYALYALYDFFVEVELHCRTDKIIGKNHFKTGKLLDRYAGSIDINNSLD
ncbi:hypothetical protein R3X28_05085 [Maribacter sp. TH_r10]|uniref:hypothetical protein n=1 Tax=Maribacter sp. TH_r10 TaxID=3082086 RepID=UPI002954CDBE|nr:hypothetical protein [Maribacter sp. TH_r10]MDV7138237.1 hypothetical protein [Maribacter sp. TH_r10]